MHTLILFRHGKTEPYSEGTPDESRTLVERGHEDVRLVAECLKQHQFTPTRALVSTARRTRETWLTAAPFLGTIPATYLDELYLAEPREIIEQIEAFQDTECLIVIGHNPGFHDLALFLMTHGGYEDYAASVLLREKFPTSGAAVFTSPDDMPFSNASFRLSAFVTAKALRPNPV